MKNGEDGDRGGLRVDGGWLGMGGSGADRRGVACVVHPEGRVRELMGHRVRQVKGLQVGGQRCRKAWRRGRRPRIGLNVATGEQTRTPATWRGRGRSGRRRSVRLGMRQGARSAGVGWAEQCARPQEGGDKELPGGRAWAFTRRRGAKGEL